MPDTGVINADILDPINNPASNTFFNLAGTDIDFKADNLSFIGVDDVGYKRNDSWPEWAFMTASVTGKMEFENCHWSGAAGIGYYLNSSPDKLDLILKDCQADGGDNGMEVLLNWYGDNEEDLLYMENCHFKNIGQEEAWSFNAKNRGVIYVRPWKSHKAVGCTFENILDRWQDYDGGGSDRIHTFKGSRQSFEDCVFLANGKNTLYAYYGSRTAPLTEFNRCKFKGINGGNIFIGIAARSTSKIHNCQFGPGVSIPIFTQSNNNVWTEETFIDVDRCIFHSGGIEIYPNSPPVAPVHINIRNSEFPLDTNYTDGQRIKIHPGGNKAKVLLENLVFKDTNTNSGSIIFFEGGASADIIARNCYFGYNDGANQVEIVKQLRGTSTVTFIDCEVPDTITPRFTIDPYSGESGAKLYGRNNRFSNYSINNNPGNPAQAFDCYQIGTHTGVTDVNGEISVTLNQSCDFDWADIQIIGNNDFHADVISIDSSALNIRIKDDTGANVSSTSVQFNYTINKK